MGLQSSLYNVVDGQEIKVNNHTLVFVCGGTGDVTVDIKTNETQGYVAEGTTMACPGTYTGTFPDSTIQVNVPATATVSIEILTGANRNNFDVL